LFALVPGWPGWAGFSWVGWVVACICVWLQSGIYLAPMLRSAAPASLQTPCPLPPAVVQPVEGNPLIERFAKLAAELGVVLPSEYDGSQAQQLWGKGTLRALGALLQGARVSCYRLSSCFAAGLLSTYTALPSHLPAVPCPPVGPTHTFRNPAGTMPPSPAFLPCPCCSLLL